jgi:solute carrier family 25 phosphate transporter 23/24/25/41
MGSLDAPDAVDKLWEILDTRRQGYVDYNGLKRGLKRMDHREHIHLSISA